MIETRQALDNLDSILSVEGLDAVYIGPSDLSLSLGCNPSFDEVEAPVAQAIDHILERAKAHGLVAAIHNGTPDVALKRIAKGFQFVTVSSDARLMAAGAKQVLGADRGSVWLYDDATRELVLEVATGIKPVRVPWDAGLVGACAQSRRIINVPDCYADPRFDASTDRATGFHTRCSLTLPLIDHQEALIGVMQVLNKDGGVFDGGDEMLAAALAAQCAIALARVRMTEALIEGERLKRELELARLVQLSSLPAVMPLIPGYDVHGLFLPAEQTGGDTFDLAQIEQGVLIVLGDAAGHGIAPALSVVQMQAMLRMAFRLGADGWRGRNATKCGTCAHSSGNRRQRN